MSIQDDVVDLEIGIRKKGQNCYAWAVRYEQAVDPGELSGRKYGTNSNENLRQAVVRDGLIYHGATLPAVRVGHYVVALIASDDDSTAYHFIRRDDQVTWSHKPGEGDVRYRDADGAQLTDIHPPHQANFNYEANFQGKLSGLLLMAKAQGWGTNYNRFVGYFYCPNGGLAMQSSYSWCTIL